MKLLKEHGIHQVLLCDNAFFQRCLDRPTRPLMSSSVSIVRTVLLPTGIATMTYFLFRIYWKVRKDQQRSLQWRFDQQATGSSSWRTPKGMRIKDQRSQSLRRDANLLALQRLQSLHPTQPQHSSISQSQKEELGSAAFSTSVGEEHPCNYQNNDTGDSTRSGGTSVDQGSRKRRQGRKRTELEKKVSWQCARYFLAFLLVWPFPIAVALVEARTLSVPYHIFLILAFMSPLQGFANAIVYFSPRLSCPSCCHWACKRNTGAKEDQQRMRSDQHDTPPQRRNSQTTVGLSVSGQGMGGVRAGRGIEGVAPDDEFPSLNSMMAEWEPTTRLNVDRAIDSDNDDDHSDILSLPDPTGRVTVEDP